MNETIAYEYIGEGTFEQGIPARGLTAEEWGALPPETQKRLLDRKIYKPVKAQKDAPIKKEGE